MKSKLMALLCLLSYGIVQSQTCLTDKLNDQILQKDSALRAQSEEFYAGVQAISSSKRASKYIVPVVFHVIHTDGSENISKQQIDDQIRILNEDYSYNNSNKSSIRQIFQGVAADMEIEFRLAKIDPAGNCTDGINRVYSSKHINAGDAVKMLANARWPNQNYLNIWTVSSINSDNSPGTILGYAYFPSTSAGLTYSSIDGVIVRSDYVGSMGTSNANKAGRVLTHEVGHYLGLLHPFQDSCDGGDHCDDTPPVYGTFANANCNPSVNTCHNDIPDLPDMFENYMDYSEGRCQALFTLDQKAIVHHTFEFYSHRKHLVSQENLIATGVLLQDHAPLAGFGSDVQIICAGESVSFYEAGCVSQASSRNWTFEGADITTSNSANPTVTYSQPGSYKVSLSVSNSFGSNEIVKESYITVLPSEAIDKGYLRQTFESPYFREGEGWTTVTEEGQSAFIRTTEVAYSGSASLLAPINGATRKGKLYRLISPKVDLRPLTGKGPRLSFMCAYAKPDLDANDVLKVYSSVDCGNTWVLRYTQSGTGLYSTTYAEYAYIPHSKDEWKRHSVTLNSLQNESNVMFMIEVTSDAGGPLYIDDINVSQFNTGMTELQSEIQLQIAPVPVNAQTSISFDAFEGGQAALEVFDAYGRSVYTQNYEVGAGQQEIKLGNAWVRNSGVYFLKLSIGSLIYKSKITAITE